MTGPEARHLPSIWEHGTTLAALHDAGADVTGVHRSHQAVDPNPQAVLQRRQAAPAMQQAVPIDSD
eukprot:7384765-Prorocentrum_lima.AAC.1